MLTHEIWPSVAPWLSLLRAWLKRARKREQRLCVSSLISKKSSPCHLSVLNSSFYPLIKSDGPSLICFTDAGWWGEEMQILAGQNRRRIAVAVPTEEGMKEEERFCWCCCCWWCSMLMLLNTDVVAVVQCWCCWILMLLLLTVDVVAVVKCWCCCCFTLSLLVVFVVSWYML